MSMREHMDTAHRKGAVAVGHLSLMLASGRLNLRNLAEAAAAMAEANQAVQAALSAAQRQAASKAKGGDRKE